VYTGYDGHRIEELLMMDLIFHGVRGSHPVADSDMLKYGGNTPCVEIVKSNKEGIKVPLVFDAGSGIIKYGYALAARFFANEYSRTFPLFFTHLHPDHTEGFNFFTPNFLPFCTMHILGMDNYKEHVGEILRKKMLAPNFPIQYKDFKSVRKHHTLFDGDTLFIDQDGNPVKECENPLFELHMMQSFAPSHPQQGAMYYRIKDSDDGSSVALIWDIESHLGGDVRVIKFSKNADIMVHDTQYSDEEYADSNVPVQGFGHSAFGMAVENAKRAKVKYLCPFHYSPRHSDSFLDTIEKKYKTGFPFECIMSREGLCLTLDKGKIVKREDIKLGFAKK
jgi:ribonuclease BN (tRNA processing enzyme)